MTISTYEGIVENGKIRLKAAIKLPESATVYVIVPQIATQQTVKWRTPRLVNPEQVKDFQMEITEDLTNAAV
ncbi:MAG: hypothetical protein OHK0052_07620 [Anaerolineales bacterium]